MGSNRTLKSYPSYLSAAVANNRATIANTLLMWYIFLGGQVKEETLWAVDKSCAILDISVIHWNNTLLLVYQSDGRYSQWKSSPTSLLPPGIFGGVEETICVLDSNGLPVVFRYLQGGRKT